MWRKSEIMNPKKSTILDFMICFPHEKKAELLILSKQEWACDSSAFTSIHLFSVYEGTCDIQLFMSGVQSAL